MKAMKQYVARIITQFEDEQFKQPMCDDIVFHMNINEKKRIWGMFGSIDYMYWP
jgi:hypothetical protein